MKEIKIEFKITYHNNDSNGYYEGGFKEMDDKGRLDFKGFLERVSEHLQTKLERNDKSTIGS